MADQPPRNAYCKLRNHFVHLFAHLDRAGITSSIMSSTRIFMSYASLIIKMLGMLGHTSLLSHEKAHTT